jgi:hypothetical protein
MVSKASIFTPCPPSPARQAIAQTDRSDAWITSWLTDLAVIYPEFLEDIPGYANLSLPKPSSKWDTPMTPMGVLWPSWIKLRTSRLRSRSTWLWSESSSMRHKDFTLVFTKNLPFSKPLQGPHHRRNRLLLSLANWKVATPVPRQS